MYVNFFQCITKNITKSKRSQQTIMSRLLEYHRQTQTHKHKNYHVMIYEMSQNMKKKKLKYHNKLGVKKSPIRKTPNLSTDADSSTDTFFPLASPKALIAFRIRFDLFLVWLREAIRKNCRSFGQCPRGGGVNRNLNVLR